MPFMVLELQSLIAAGPSVIGKNRAIEAFDASKSPLDKLLFFRVRFRDRTMDCHRHSCAQRKLLFDSSVPTSKGYF